jgi:hypothetical protein
MNRLMKFLAALSSILLGTSLIASCGLDVVGSGSNPDAGPESGSDATANETGVDTGIDSASDAGSSDGSDAEPDANPDAPAPICGNNLREGTEICDGTDLGGKSCMTLPGFNNGTLSCQPDCSYNTIFCHPTPPTCNAGAAGTVDFANGNGGTDFGYLLHYAEDPEFYSSAMPTNKTFTGVKLPGQLVLAGKDGVSFVLEKGGVTAPKLWYKTTAASLPADCNGVGIKSEVCLSKVAKSFRCQTTPYFEGGVCPSPAVIFTAQPLAAVASDSTAGWQIWLVDLTCS